MMLNKVNILNYFKPHPKQLEVLPYIGKGYNIFYGGAKGGGKTDMSIFVAFLTALQYPQTKICFIRETYPELETEILERIFVRYPASEFKYKYNDRKKMLKFANNSIIVFRSIASQVDVRKIQGIEFQLIIIDEAQNFDEEVIHRIETSLRTSKNPNFIPTLLMTGNPLGRSDYYFYTRFVQPDYSVWTEAELMNKDRYVFIPAKVTDNPSVHEDYINRLKMLPRHIQEAYLNGSWSATEGAFFDMFNPITHVIEPFEIPESWPKRAGLDIGWSSYHPTVCLWLAQNPETLEVFVYREYVGVGTTETYADDIIRLEESDGEVLTFADPSMFHKARPMYEVHETEAYIFLRKGKPLFPAINDRIQGWRIVKNWMASGKLKIFRNCKYLIQTIPQQKYKGLGSQSEDLDTTGRDDAVDALRYALVSGFTYPVEVVEKIEEPKPVEEPYYLNKSIKRDEPEQVVKFDKAQY